MYLDAVEKYYAKDYNLNCAETMIYAANEFYNLKLDKKVLKTMAAFGGGMGVEEACGAMTGGLAVLGILFVKDRAKESGRIKELSKEYVENFRQRLGTENCKRLKALYRKDNSGCEYIMRLAAEELEKIIDREGMEE